MERAESLLNSNESFVLTNDFHITVKLYKKKKLAGGALKRLAQFNNYEECLRKKKSVLMLATKKTDQKNLCFAKAVQLLLAHKRCRRLLK